MKPYFAARFGHLDIGLDYVARSASSGFRQVPDQDGSYEGYFERAGDSLLYLMKAKKPGMTRNFAAAVFGNEPKKVVDIMDTLDVRLKEAGIVTEQLDPLTLNLAVALAIQDLAGSGVFVR